MNRLRSAWTHWRERREFDRAHKRGTPVEIITPPGGIRVHMERDWIDDPDLSAVEKMRRFEALHPEQTRSPFYLITTPPTFTAGTNVTWGFHA